MQVPMPICRFQHKDQFNNPAWQFWTTLAIKNSYKYKLMHAWITCELEYLLLEAFKEKDNYDLFSHHYKLWNTTAFGITASLLPTSEYGFFLKEELIRRWVDETAVGSISLYYSQVYRYLRPHLEEACKYLFHTLALKPACVLPQCQRRQKDLCE